MTTTLRSTTVSRADLLWACVAEGEEGLQAAANLLGYVEVPAPPPQEERLPREESVERTKEGQKASRVSRPPTPTQIEYEPIPFWHAVAVERAEDHEPGNEPLKPLTAGQLSRIPGAVRPERQPLVPWPVLRRVLDEHLRPPRESHRLDVDRLAALWCRGRVPRRLPRQVRRHLGRVSLIVDRDRRLAPFWDDQGKVAQELLTYLPPTNLRILSSPDDGTSPMGALDENDVVMVLGDLGFYADDPTPWLRLARRLRRIGARPWALVPCPPRRWHRPTARAWGATDWSAPYRAGRGGETVEVHRAEQQMLRLLALAVRIEPGLVRELRRLVPGADCGLEVELKQHEELAAGSSSAWQFTGTAVQRLRGELAGLPPERLLSAAKVVIRWHRHLKADVRSELAEVLRSLGLSLDEELAVVRDEAVAIFEGVAAVLEQGERADPQLLAALSAWLPRVTNQLPASAWRGRLGKPLVRAFAAYLEKYPEAPPPPGLPTELLASQRSERSIERWDIRQVGDRLRIEPANTWGQGSFLATLSAREPEVWLRDDWGTPQVIDFDEGCPLPVDLGESLRLVSDVEQVVLESTLGPPWARRAGRDGYGLWAAFEVRGVEQRMRWIPPGRFRMGSPETEDGRYEDEGPLHTVALTEGFWLGEVPCTQELYEAVMGENPSRFRSAKRPVEQVSWKDCQNFFKQLGGRVPGLTGRLPSEAEWEYACRAGTETATWLGDLEILGQNNSPLLDEIAWYGGNSGVEFELESGVDSSAWPEKHYPHSNAGTREVASKSPNPWGLYDMLGNVFEWCQDSWGGGSGYPGGDRVDPVGASGSYRVLRGGSWLSNALLVRAAYRGWRDPGLRARRYGFRLSSGPGLRS